MKIKLQMVMWGALALSACASAPTTPAGVPVEFIGCSSAVKDPGELGGDPTAALIVLGLETGYDIAAYSTCAVARLVHPGSTGTVSGGVYRSGRGTFSVALLSPPPSMQKPSIGILQPTVLPSESVLIRPLDDGKPVMMSGLVEIGAAISLETMLQQSSTLEQAGLDEMQRQAGPTAATPLHHEAVTLDGRPALFAVYSSTLHTDGSQTSPAYLFVYFTRDQDHSAVLTVLWSGACPVCADGHEADIRKLDPDIGRVVDSFHLDEPALLAWDSANPKPAEKPLPPALPSMTVPPGKAVIYFYREAGWAGRSLDFHIWEDQNEIGNLTHGTYLHVVVDPAQHSYIITTKHDDYSPCAIDIKSGEIRYFEVYVSRPELYGQSLELTCREPPELETRTKMVDLKDVTDD